MKKLFTLTFIFLIIQSSFSQVLSKRIAQDQRKTLSSELDTKVIPVYNLNAKIDTLKLLREDFSYGQCYHRTIRITDACSRFIRVTSSLACAQTRTIEEAILG